jgi:hypothetical protein
MIKSPTVNKEQFDKDGFMIFKKIFSSEEIERFRSDCYRQYEEDSKAGLAYSVPNTNARTVKGDMLSKKFLRKILMDERVIAVGREILGHDIVYFRDSTFQIGVGLRGYHRDNVNREYNSGPDWEGDYTIIRFGLYMQDHSNYSGGLKVRKGSHKNPSGKSIILDTEIGDLVVWSLRTLHSGNAVRLKLLSNMPIDYMERHVPEFLKQDEAKERVACFFSFGVNDKHLQNYLNGYIRKSESVKNNLKASTVEQEVVMDLQKAGIAFVDPIE